MSNLLNLSAEVGADLIADDAQPALTIKNTGSGPGLRTEGIVLTSTASVDIVNTTTLNYSGAANRLTVQKTTVGNQSLGILRIMGNSTASVAMIEFANKGFISITSTVLTTVANTDYAIPVQVGLETRYIPLFKSAAIIGAAAVD